MRRLFPVPTSVLLLACLLAGASVALAGAEVGRGSSGDQQTIPTDASRRFSEESPLSMRGAPGQLLLEGTVTDILGTPMEGVPVKLFGNGRVIHSTLSGADGRYRLEANPLFGPTRTVSLWFESPDTEQYLDFSVVLAEGETAEKRGLFPPCTQRVSPAGESVRVDVALKSLADRQKELSRSGCMSAE